MTAPKPKFYVANTHTNRISYRKLSAFENRNPRIFSLSHSAHDSWGAAHRRLIERRVADVNKARKELARAESALARARSMKKPEGA